MSNTSHLEAIRTRGRFREPDAGLSDAPSLSAASAAGFRQVEAVAPPPLAVKSRSTLGELAGALRSEAGGYPLTVVLHGWGSESARDFLTALARILHREDAVWLVPTSSPSGAAPAGIWESAVVLDLASKTDERIYFNLVGDLIFFPGVAENEDIWLGEWKRRTRAVVVGGAGAFADAVAWAGISENLRVYRWSEGEEVALLGAAAE